MRPVKIAVCDDCPEDTRFLQNHLQGHDVSVYFNTDSILADVEGRNKRYDLYLLDIYVDDSMNGVDLAKRIRNVQEEAVICFISTSDDFYREAYDLYAVQYLIKPVQESALTQLIDRVLGMIGRKMEKSLSFKSRGQTGTLSYSKILYIGSREHTICIYCTDGTVQEYKGKLNELAAQICGEEFMRCHQSFLVNMYYVDNLSGNDLMVSGYRIPVSRRYYAEVKRRYQEILFEEVD